MVYRLVSQTLSDPDLFYKCRWLRGRVGVSHVAIHGGLKPHSNVKWMVRDVHHPLGFKQHALEDPDVFYICN